MNEFRPWRQATKRTVVDYDNFISKSSEDFIVCINGGVLAILRKLVRERGLWRTTYAVSTSNDGYLIPDDTEFANIQRKISGFLEDTNEVEMCNSAIIDALTAIAQSAASGGGCGCGSGDAGSNEPTASVEVVDPPDTPGGDFPAEFSTQEEYETYKCDVADWILTSLRADVVVYQTADIASMTLIIFVALLITPVPGARVVALLIAVIGLLGLGASALTNFVTAIDDGWDAMLCALYDSTDVSDAETDFKAAFYTAVDTEVADIAIRFAIKAVFDIMVSNAILNKLFEKDEFTNFGTGDCAACFSAWWSCYAGTITAETDDTLSVDSVQDFGDDRWYCSVGMFDGLGPKSISIVVDSGTWAGHAQAVSIHNHGGNNLSCASGSGWDTHSDVEGLGPHTNLGTIRLSSLTEFSVTFTKS